MNNPITFFKIILSFKIWDKNISKEYLLITGSQAYIIDRETKNLIFGLM